MRQGLIRKSSRRRNEETDQIHTALWSHAIACRAHSRGTSRHYLSTSLNEVIGFSGQTAGGEGRPRTWVSPPPSLWGHALGDGTRGLWLWTWEDIAKSSFRRRRRRSLSSSVILVIVDHDQSTTRAHQGESTKLDHAARQSEQELPMRAAVPVRQDTLAAAQERRIIAATTNRMANACDQARASASTALAISWLRRATARLWAAASAS